MPREMRTSPRKRANERGDAAPPTPPPPARKRAPQRCQVCPNKPLRSQCEHRFRRKKVTTSPSSGQIDATSSPSLFPVPGTQASAGQPPPVVVAEQAAAGRQGPVPAPLVPQLAHAPPLTFAQLLSQVPAPQTVPPANVLPPPPSSLFPQAPGADNPTSLPSGGTAVDIPLDPALFLPNTDEAEEPPCDDPPFDEPDLQQPTDSDEETRPRSSKAKKKKKKRVYPSARNPFCGKVEGVARGDRPASDDFPRRRELKEPYLDPGIAAKRWDVWVQDLMTRAESISDRSSCWLYVAVQHPSSKFAFAHFTSQKLRREAPQDVAIIHKHVSRMMNRVKRADRTSLIECDRQREEALERAQEAEERANQAEERAARAESEAQRLQAEVNARERLISSLSPSRSSQK